MIQAPRTIDRNAVAAVEAAVEESRKPNLDPYGFVSQLRSAGWPDRFGEYLVSRAFSQAEGLTHAYPRGSAPASNLSANQIADLAKAANLSYLGLALWIVGMAAFAIQGGTAFAISPVFGFTFLAACQTPCVTGALRSAVAAGPAIGHSRWSLLITAIFSAAFPLGGFFYVVILNSRYTDLLRRSGVAFGFLGPVRASIFIEMARRMHVDTERTLP